MRLISHFAARGTRMLSCGILALLATASSNAESLSVPTASTQPHTCGAFSDTFIVGNRASLIPSGSHYSIMSSRYRDLNEAIKGKALSGHYLVAFDGNRFRPAGYSDDPGIYLFIPWLANHMHMTLEAVVTTFFLSSLGLGMFVGCLGSWLSLKSRLGKYLSIAGVLLLGLIAYRIGDLYLFEFAVPVALVPWTLRFVSPSIKSGLLTYACIVGLITGVAGVIRTSAALPMLLFLIVFLFFNGVQIKWRLAAASLLLCGFLLPKLYIYDLSLRRDSFLARTSMGQPVETTRHVFWHFAYVGLGFLSNPYVPGGICDEVGKARVQAIDPNAAYLSAAYDRVLRRETLTTVRQHPTIVLFTLFAKLGIIASLFIIFANIGLVAAFVYRKPAPVDLAFWVALAICIGPLLIMAPLPLYSVGLISWAAIYGIASLDHALHVRQRTLLHEIDMAEPMTAVAVAIGEGSSRKIPADWLS